MEEVSAALSMLSKHPNSPVTDTVNLEVGRDGLKVIRPITSNVAANKTAPSVVGGGMQAC